MVFEFLYTDVFTINYKPFKISEHQLTRLLNEGTFLSFSDFLDLLWR